VKAGTPNRVVELKQMAYVTGLRCTKCGKLYSPEDRVFTCMEDEGRLDVEYDYDSMATKISREILEQRRGGLWKYREFLPIENEENIVTLGEVQTPLIRGRNLGKILGMRNLYLKDETKNPTASFKDRPMTVGVSKGVELGFNTTVSASSGNAAAALAAYSAKARLTCYTFVPEKASPGKIAQLNMFGANVVRLKGLESGVDPTVTMLRLVCKRFGWYPCPSFALFNPYQAEGPKTMSYEIAEQLNWETPDWVLAGVGSGGLLAGNWKGYRELKRFGFVRGHPRMVAVQSTGCAPVVRAFDEGMGSHKIVPWEHPDTIATGLMDPLPWDGDAALRALDDSSGTAVKVTNDEILDAQRTLAKSEGVFAEPSGVAVLAGLTRLRDQGTITADDRVVLEITGSGLKDLNVIGLVETPLIDPDIEALQRVLKLKK
jgi:threonine synthase